MKAIKRKPRVVAIERRMIHQVRRSGRHTIHRWYVTLRFGEIEEKLAVSAEVVHWLKSSSRS
jgi:hypothetical protein